MGVQDLLDNPNPASPANQEAIDLWTKNREQYKKRVESQVKAARQAELMREREQSSQSHKS